MMKRLVVAVRLCQVTKDSNDPSPTEKKNACKCDKIAGNANMWWCMLGISEEDQEDPNVVAVTITVGAFML